MSHRDSFVQNLKTFRSKERAEFEDAMEREEREKAEAPIRSAQAEQNRLLSQIRDAEKVEVIAGRKDPGFVIPQSVLGLRMSFDEAQKFNVAEADKFTQSTPEFYTTERNIETLFEFLRQQEVYIADESTLKAAYERLRFLGLLEQKPEEVVSVVPKSEPVRAKPKTELPAKKEPVTYIGVDGRQYSEQEVWRMSSVEMKTAFGLYGPRLPKFSDVIPA